MRSLAEGNFLSNGEPEHEVAPKNRTGNIRATAVFLAESRSSMFSSLARAGRHAMQTITGALGVARSNLAIQAMAAPRQRRARRPKPDVELLPEIQEIIAGPPTYGCMRVHADPAASPNKAERRSTSDESTRRRRRIGCYSTGIPGNCAARQHDGRNRSDLR